MIRMPSTYRSILLALLIAGCVTLPLPSRPGSPNHRLPEGMDGYDYPKQPLVEKILSEETRHGYSLLRLTLSSGGADAAQPIRVDWYRSSRSGRLPVILISPILAGNDLYIRDFANYYAARGLHAVIVYRPKEIFSGNRPLQDIENHLRESILQMRRALDWLEQRDSVDAQRIGSFAISLGAILTCVLAAVEPRIRATVLGLPAGDIAEILMTSQDKSIRKRRRNYLKENRLTEEEALERLKAAIRSEPMRFAPYVPPDRALIIAGLFDRVVGFQRSLELWRKMGRPPLILLPTGHYSAALATPYLKAATYSFLRRKLAAE